MQFARTKLIESINSLLSEETTGQYIAIVAARGMGKSTFLNLLQDSGTLDAESTTALSYEDIESWTQSPLPDTIDTVVIDGDITVDFSTIRTFIESYQSITTVLFSSEHSVDDAEVTNFILPGISFREYSEANGFAINVGDIMNWTADIDGLNVQKDAYIHLGQYPKNLLDPEHISVDFSEKISVMVQELFKKEENDFMEFIRIVAMWTGDLFKEERIAKLMNISRRKVRKYTEIILRHGLVHAIGPYVLNTDTELSRHVKLYWNDLSYLNSALWVMYYQGITKQGVIENFILLELERKLSSTHDIRFYRKKSGAEIQFLLENKTTRKLTPIEVRIGNNTAISQAMKSFDESYNQFVENYMIFDESETGQKTLNEKNVIILPHVAI